MNYIKTLLIVLGILIVNHAFGLRSGTQFFVSPNGNDNNPGSKSQPFKTLEKARDAIQNLKLEDEFKGCQVFLREGTYFRTKTFVLNEKDSGTESATIIYSAYKNEKVVIHGGKSIPLDKENSSIAPEILSRFQVAVQDKIVEIDLKQKGINEYGKLRPVGFSRSYGPAWAAFCKWRALRFGALAQRFNHKNGKSS